MKKLVRNFVDEAVATLAKPSQSDTKPSTHQYSTYGLPLPVSPLQGQYGQHSPYEQQALPYGYSTASVQPASYNIPSSAQYFPPPPNAQTSVPLAYYTYQPPMIPAQHAVYRPPAPQQQQARPHEPPGQPAQAAIAQQAPYWYPTSPPQAEATQHRPVISATPTPQPQPQYGVPPTYPPNYDVTPAPVQSDTPPQNQHQYQYKAQYAPPPATPTPPQSNAMTVPQVTPPEHSTPSLATPTQYEPAAEVGTGAQHHGPIVEIATSTQHESLVEIGTSTIPVAPVEAPTYSPSPVELQNPAQSPAHPQLLPNTVVQQHSVAQPAAEPQLLSSTPVQQHIVVQPPVVHSQEQRYFPPPPPQLPTPSPQPTPQPQALTNYTPAFQPPAQPPSKAQQPYFPPPPSQPSANTPAPQNYAPSASNLPPPAFNNGNNQDVYSASAPNQYQHQYAPPQHYASQAPVGQPVPSPEGPFTHLSSLMDKLNVQSNTYPAPPNFTPPAVDDGPREYPPIRTSEEPNEALTECPGLSARTYSLAWYRLVEQPDFLTCTRCYIDHIQDTPLAHKFERIQRPAGTPSACNFGQPRVKDRLWPAAVRSNNTTDMSDYMGRRLKIPACLGRAATTGGESRKWYGLAQRGVLDEFVTCEACYEDHIAGTGFETRFPLRREQSAGEKHGCGMSIPYVQTLAGKTVKTNNWDEFTAGFSRRFRLPACEGKQMPGNSVTWYVTRQKIKKMRICEACYLDKAALSRFKSDFEQYVPPSGLKSLKEIVSQSACLFGRFAVTIAWDVALYRRDFSVFWKAANTIAPIVPCTADGIIGGNWWTLAGGCDGFSVCETCYAGIFETLGVTRFLEKTRREGGILCSFCPVTPQNVRIVLKFSEAFDTGLFTPFEEYVRKWADVTPCPGIDAREKGKWYGWPDVLACPECYHGFVADTALGDAMPCKNQFAENPNICQMWSPRMRNMWLDTCAAGPPGSAASQAAVAKLEAFGARRMLMYKQTVMQIEQLEMLRLSKIMLANAQSNAAATQDAMATQGSVFGASDPGAHIAAANAMQQANATMAEANSPQHFHTVARLKAMWLEVE